MIINHLKQTKYLFFLLLIFFIFLLVSPIYAQNPTPTPLDALISWNPPITLTRELNVNYETFVVNDLLAVNDIIYATTDNGLFVSDNQGKSWQGLSNTLLNYDIRSLLEMDGRLYAGAVGGMFVSYNQGKTWQTINNGLPDMIKVNSLLTSKGTLYAGTSTGVFVSDDKGELWQSIGQGLPEGININGLLEAEGQIYASSLNGVFASNDGGNSWRAVNEGLTASAILSMTASDGRLYAGTFIGVFASDNGGKNWQWMNKGMTSSIISSLLEVNGRLYAGTNNGEINISDDRGESWQKINKQLTSTTISSLLEVNGRLYAGSLNGIFISDDRAETWQGTANMLSNSTVLTALGVNGRLYVGTDGGGIFTSKDSGRSWQAINEGLADRFPRLLLAVKDRLYVGTRDSGVYVSKDAGETWLAMNEGLTDMSILSLLELDGRLYAGTGSGKVFMFSQSEGGLWQDISEGLPDSAGTLSLLVMDRRLYAGTRGVGVYTLELGGKSNIWQEANNGLTSKFVNSLLEVKGKLYAATNSGIFISSDNGLNWHEADVNMSDITVLSMLELDGQLYAATNNGLFGSQDAGFNWRKMSEGMSNLFVKTLIRMKGRLYAGTKGGGIFVSGDKGSTWNPANGQVPLHQTALESFPLFIQDLLPSDIQDMAYVATRGGGVWTMTTKGVNKLPILDDQNAQSLAIDEEQIYVATLNGLLFNDQSWKGVPDKNLQGDVVYDVAVVASSSFSLQRIIETLSFRSSTIYAVTSDQTMYKSIDNGMTLQAMPAKIPGFKTISLLIASDKTIYAATVEGLYHSSDGGQSWQPTSVMGDVVYDLATLDGQTFYAATSGGLFKSELQEDGTSNWVRSLTGEFSSVLVHPSNSQIIMAAAGNRLQLSRDAGNAWEELPLPPDMTVDIIAISANFPDILWAADVQTGRVVRGQISSIEIPGQTIWFQVIAVWGGWFLIVGLVGLFGLSRYSGLSLSLLLRQNIMLLPVALKYSDYRQKWEIGSPLAQLLVLLVPPRKGLSTQEFILALNRLDVPLETDQLETELDSAIRSNLLCQKEGRYHATTPPLAVALQDHEGKTSRFHLAEKIRHDHPLSANARRFFSRAGFNLKPVLGQNQLPYRSRSKVDSSGFVKRNLRRFFGRAAFNLKPVLKQEQLLYRAEVASTGFMKRNLPAKIYARFLPGEILDDEEVLNIKEQVYQVDRHATVIFVVTNRRPTEAGWAQIGTLRLSGLIILPLDNALINEGLSSGRERMLLRNEIEQRLGTDYDPYDVRDPVAGAFSFFGREVLVETLFRRLVKGRQFGIFGLRKLGKSSLLHALRSRTPFPVAEINLQTIGRNKNLDDLYRRIFRYWQQEIRLKTNLNWTAPSVQTNQTNFVNITLDLLNWMGENKVEPRLGLFLDEVELLVPRPDGSGPDLERYLTFMGAVRGLIDEDGRLSLVVASLNPSISRINAWDGEQNPTFNLFQEVNLPPLSFEDIIKMVRHIGLQIGLVYSEESLTEIANLSGGHPFLARQLCSLLYKQRSYHVGQIEVSEIPDGVHQFIYDDATVTHLENGLWQEAGNAAVWGKVGAKANQAILLELARSDSIITRLKPEMITGLDRNDVQAALINLEKYYFVRQPETGYYNIQFGLLREWLRRRKLKL